MIMYGQEDDVLHWSINSFNDPFQNSGYCGGHIQSDATFCNGCYHGEVPGPPQLAEEQLGMSNVEHDWFGLSIRNYNHSYDGCEEETEEADEMELSSSCSSPREVLREEEWPLELLDDCSEIDGEVGKRLNQMVPIPHVPKINGEIPSIDEAISDHQRLIDRLWLYDLVELKVEGDGNCQFRALSDQFYRSSEHHKFVRQQVLNQLESNRDIYEGYVPMEYGNYLKKLSKTGEWGDHVTLQAAADSYGVKIFVITSFKDTCSIEILPNVQKSKRVIFLSFWAEVHYNSIYPEGGLFRCEHLTDPGDRLEDSTLISSFGSSYSDLPASETKKKKRWWRFGNKH